MDTRRQAQKRIINVSNRLPVKISVTDEKIVYHNSEGGLATGLGSVFSQYENIWIGWPGADIDETKKDAVINDLQVNNLHPIFLSRHEIHKFYEGFSNEIIWPLFHYFPTYSVYDPAYWETYESVNRKFANEILKFATKDDIIWIQDYHLMLVPAMLRAANPELSIGYFQHIPFPSYDLFKALPWKEQIIDGLLGANIVGFQTENDVKHFSEATKLIKEIDFPGNEIPGMTHRVSVASFPISIDYKKYNELAALDTTKKIAQKIKKLINTKIVISIDRLDYSKGIIQRLQAFEQFLKQHPECRQKVTYIHLIVPSRENVGSYKSLKEDMNRLISDINGKYATFGWQPIHHFYRSLPSNLLSALYRCADVALVTPLIDGMNLVSKEYVASNVGQNGVLILGENAGAANELEEALIINPNDINAFAGAIHQALNMPLEDRKFCMAEMQRKIERADIFNWAQDFLDRLNEMKGRKAKMPVKVTDEVLEKIEHLYSVSQRRLILLDYDGTVVPFYKRPEDARPDAALLRTLKQLASDVHNDVVIISGRDNLTLEKWLGHLPVKIIAEHGAWYKEHGKGWQTAAHLQTNWKADVSKTFANYSTKAPGTFVEEKAFSIAWHYRTAHTNMIEQYVKDVIRNLKHKLNKNLDILMGNKVIEVKDKGVNKGKAALKLIARKKYDFIMAIGDDKTDEDMFKALPEDTISIKVGYENSAAVYCQPSYKEVNQLLRTITDHKKIPFAMS